MRSLASFLDIHRRRARLFLHGVLLGTVLGAAVGASAGSISWSLFAIWLLLYLAVGLTLELLLARHREQLPHVESDRSHSALIHRLDPVDSLIANSQQVDLLAGTLKTFTESSANLRALHDRHRDGAQVRILLMAPEGAGARLAAAERQQRGAALPAGEFRQEIAQSIGRLLLEFPSQALTQIVRMYASSPHAGMARYGDLYILTVYTFGRGSSSPALALRRHRHAGFCDGLDRGFQELWEARDTVPLDSRLLTTLELTLQRR